MTGLLVALWPLVAQAAPAAAPARQSDSIYQYLIYLLPLPIVYLLLIRPQQVEQKSRKQMLDQLTKGDKVLTGAGMYGTVQSVDEAGDKVVLRLDDEGRVKATFTRASIARVLKADAAAKPGDAK